MKTSIVETYSSSSSFRAQKSSEAVSKWPWEQQEINIYRCVCVFVYLMQILSLLLFKLSTNSN